MLLPQKNHQGLENGPLHPISRCSLNISLTISFLFLDLNFIDHIDSIHIPPDYNSIKSLIINKLDPEKCSCMGNNG